MKTKTIISLSSLLLLLMASCGQKNSSSSQVDFSSSSKENITTISSSQDESSVRSTSFLPKEEIRAYAASTAYLRDFYTQENIDGMEFHYQCEVEEYHCGNYKIYMAKTNWRFFIEQNDSLLNHLFSDIRSNYAGSTEQEKKVMEESFDEEGYFAFGMEKISDGEERANLVIPDYFNDVPVIGIASLLYAYSSNPTGYSEVTFDEITSIRLPYTLKHLCQNTFTSFPNLESLNGYTEFSFIPASAFSGLEKFKGDDLAANAIGINNCAFRKSGMESFLASSSLRNLNDYAFDSCENLHSVDLSSTTLSAFGSHAFRNCTSLSSVSLPGNLAEITNSAFENCSSLISMEVPSHCQAIRALSFSDCTSLHQITIPETVASIQNEAFKNTAALDEITYKGTTEQWNSISIADTAFEGSSVRAVHCSNGIVNLI